MTSAFDELVIGDMVMRNRFVRAATAESLCTPAGMPTERLQEKYRALAAGGVGAIVTGFAYASPDGKPAEGALSLCGDSPEAPLRALAEAAHAHGARLVAQLAYGGSKSILSSDDPRRSTASTATHPPASALPQASAPTSGSLSVGAAAEDRAFVEDEASVENGALVENEISVEEDISVEDGVSSKEGVAVEDASAKEGASGEVENPNVDVIGPSAIAHPKTGLVPRAAAEDDLKRVRRSFAVAAARAEALGFDGVEIHAAHGYLLSQFLDGRLNRRRDAYGGTLAGRMRLSVECVEEVRRSVGSGFPVLVKLNSCDVRNDPHGERGGLAEDDAVEVAKALVGAGASAIEVSGDWHAFSPADAARGPFFAGFGARLAAELDAPVIVTGGWRDLATIERVLGRTGIAAVGMCRPLICEPGLVARWSGESAAPSRCTSCNYCARHRGVPCRRSEP